MIILLLATVWQVGNRRRWHNSRMKLQTTIVRPCKIGLSKVQGVRGRSILTGPRVCERRSMEIVGSTCAAAKGKRSASQTWTKQEWPLPMQYRGRGYNNFCHQDSSLFRCKRCCTVDKRHSTASSNTPTDTNRNFSNSLATMERKFSFSLP